MASPNANPEYIARTFSQYVKAVVQILVWAVIGLTSLAAAYVTIRALWIAVQMILQALGI